MSAYTASRVLQNKGAGDTEALGLKKAANEILAAFNSKTVLKDKHIVKQANGQISIQFPAIGKANAAYHTPGAELTGGAIESGEVVITIDDLLVSDTFLAKIDLAKAHFNVQPEYTFQLGDALAQTYDRNLFSMAIKSCRAGDTGPTSDHGAAVTDNIGLTPTVSDLKTAFYDAQVAWDEGDVPEDWRYAFVPPSVASTLAQDTTITSGDFDKRGVNDLVRGQIGELAGFKIIKTNNMAVDHTASTDYPDTAGAKYGAAATDTKILFMHRNALGTAELMGVRMEHEYSVRHKGTLLTADMAVGHGVLRPDMIREARAAA